MLKSELLYFGLTTSTSTGNYLFAQLIWSLVMLLSVGQENARKSLGRCRKVAPNLPDLHRETGLVLHKGSTGHFGLNEEPRFSEWFSDEPMIALPEYISQLLNLARC